MLVNQRTAYWIVFLFIAVVLLGTALGLPVWMIRQFAAVAPPPATSPDYVSYTPQLADGTTSYIRPESLEAMNAYTNANPQPQGVQILRGMTTAEISAYMVSQVSGGLKVDCTYCHVLTNGNFAEEGNPQKDRSRQMMQMTADLNQNFVSQLPATIGNQQVTCATCHNGQPVFNTYPAEIQNSLPLDYRLPLELAFPGDLQVEGRRDKSLEDVEVNQFAMYHMNVSLGQGCTFCHNARNFSSDEIPQKSHSIVMLQMTKHMNDQYLSIMNNRTPSCWMCHQGARVPPAAANEGRVPASLSRTP
jgi:photosynthetic reaction center cytochrome c subunit